MTFASGWRWLLPTQDEGRGHTYLWMEKRIENLQFYSSYKYAVWCYMVLVFGNVCHHLMRVSLFASENMMNRNISSSHSLQRPHYHWQYLSLPYVEYKCNRTAMAVSVSVLYVYTEYCFATKHIFQNLFSCLSNDSHSRCCLSSKE